MLFNSLHEFVCVRENVLYFLFHFKFKLKYMYWYYIRSGYAVHGCAVKIFVLLHDEKSEGETKQEKCMK